MHMPTGDRHRERRRTTGLAQFLCLTATVATFVAAGAAWGEDWPTYLHDNQRSAITAEQLDLDSITEVWQCRSPHPPQSAWGGSPARQDFW